MAFKTLVFVSLFIVAAISSVPIAEAQGGLLSSVIRITGTLFCTLNGTSIGTGTPVFPNALVLLQCASQVVSTTATNDIGGFNLMVDLEQFNTTIDPFVVVRDAGCNLMVSTPLASCNPALPSTGALLSAPLQLVGSTLQTVNVTNLISTAFQFLPKLN